MELAPEVARQIYDTRDNASLAIWPRAVAWSMSYDDGKYNPLKEFRNWLWREFSKVRVLSLPGAASLSMLAKMQEMGIGTLATSIVSPDWKIGGIWNDSELPWVKQGRKINPWDLHFDKKIKLKKASSHSSSWSTISHFIKRIKNRISVKEFIQATVTKISQQQDGSFTVSFRTEEGYIFNEQYDIVLFWPGAHEGKDFLTDRITQEASVWGRIHKIDTYQKETYERYSVFPYNISVHRWQENPAKNKDLVEKLRENQKNVLLIFGFGNSSIETARHCLRHKIPFRIVTDYPEEYFRNPYQKIDKNWRKKQLARDLNEWSFNAQEGVAYDIPSVQKIIAKLIKEEKIVYSASSTTWTHKWNSQFSVKIWKANGSEEEFSTIDETYCLYWYHADFSPIKDLVPIDETTKKTCTDLAHQWINERTNRSIPWLFVLWAWTYGDNNGVLPWIAHDVPAVLFGALVHCARLRHGNRIDYISRASRFIEKWSISVMSLIRKNKRVVN